VVARIPRTISKHEGTVVVTSMVRTPPSIAARQALNPASGSRVRMTPQSELGNISSMLFKPGRLSHPGRTQPNLALRYGTYV